MQSYLTDSWFRCYQMGLPKKISRPQKCVSGPLLEQLMINNATLIKLFSKYCLSIIDKYSFKDILFLLIDNNGVVIKLHYSPHLKDKLKKHHINEGIYLTEKSCGTNAITMAMEIKEMVLFSGDENYCYFLQEWMSIAAPLWVNNKINAYLSIWSYNKKDIDKYKILFELLLTKIKNDLSETTPFLPTDNKEPLPDIRENILKLSANGLTIKEISQQLNLSEAAIKYHRTKLCQQLCAVNISQAIAKSIKMGYLSLNTIK